MQKLTLITGADVVRCVAGGTDAQWFHPGLTVADFDSFNNSPFSKGLRLISFDCYNVGQQQLFSGIWRSGTGASYCQLDLSVTDFINLANKKFGEEKDVMAIEDISIPPDDDSSGTVRFW